MSDEIKDTDDLNVKPKKSKKQVEIADSDSTFSGIESSVELATSDVVEVTEEIVTPIKVKKRTSPWDIQRKITTSSVAKFDTTRVNFKDVNFIK